MPPLDLIIFDLDGTLFETATVDIEAYRQAFIRSGFQPPETQRMLDSFHLNLHDSLRTLVTASDDGIARLADDILALELEYIPQYGRLYEGVTEMLLRTQQLGAPLCVCSNGPAPYVQSVLEHMGIARFFSHVYGYHPGLEKHQLVARILRELGARHFALVGDSTTDEYAALSNDGVFIAVQYGYGALGPHRYTAHRPADIDALLRECVKAK